jgi:capsule polysaccharide export protein KpsE/RkpR
LLTRSRDLTETIKRIANRAADEELVRKMEKIEEPLKRHVATISTLRESMDVMEKENLLAVKPITAPAVKPLQDRISKLRNKLQGSRSTIAEGNVWAECNTYAEARAKELRQQLLLQWKAFVDQHTPGIETFKPYAKLDFCKDIFEELVELDRQSKSTQTNLPLTEAEFERVRTREERMRKLINGLELKDEPAEMQDFLKRCTQVNGVSLDELSDAVLNWLKNKKFAGSLKIVTR